MENKITIQDIKNNKDKLSKLLPSLNIDSIFLEQNGKIDKIFYNIESLHELRSCAKILVAMAIGIAIDKNLKQHGLIQAFSRTNRILNSVKSYGNIICFRDLQEQTNDAIALFGDKDASGIVLLKSYEDYYYGYEDEKGNKQLGYEQTIAILLQKYPLGEPIIGEQAKKDFIVSVGNILRLRNILSSFDKFKGNEILTERDFQDYIGTYTDLYEEFKPRRDNGEAESIKDDIVFEMELVKQVEVNIDYILMLVAKYHKSNCTDKEILGSIDKAIKSSLTLRSKKELVDEFISRINTNTDVMNDWNKFVQQQKETDLKNLIIEKNLNEIETRKFLENSFRDGQVKETGTDIEKILPPMRRFGGSNRTEKKETIIKKVKKFFEKYFGIGDFGNEEDMIVYDNTDDELSMVAENNQEYKGREEL